MITHLLLLFNLTLAALSELLHSNARPCHQLLFLSITIAYTDKETACSFRMQQNCRVPGTTRCMGLTDSCRLQAKLASRFVNATASMSKHVDPIDIRFKRSWGIDIFRCDFFELFWGVVNRISYAWIWDFWLEWYQLAMSFSCSCKLITQTSCFLLAFSLYQTSITYRSSFLISAGENRMGQSQSIHMLM